MSTNNNGTNNLYGGTAPKPGEMGTLHTPTGPVQVQNLGGGVLRRQDGGGDLRPASK